MANKRNTVEQLAIEAKLGVDEAMVLLWEAGFDEITHPKSYIRKQNSNRARRVLGMAGRREFKSISYWMSILDLYEEEFHDLLKKLAVPISKKSQTLPHKAVSRLRNEAYKREIDPITGKLSRLGKKVNVKKLPVLKFKKLGHKRELRGLGENEVEKIHFELVKDFALSPDPIIPSGVRSEHLLASALFRPKTALGTKLKYSTVEMSAAALLHSIIQDHPFHNGNKRTALVSMLVFLDENGFFPIFNEDEAFRLLLMTAQHRIALSHLSDLADREVIEITKWLCKNCRNTEKGDHSIPFRKLRQILLSYGCEFSSAPGNKLNISLTTKTTHYLLIKKQKILRTQILISNEGQDVSRGTIKKIRKALCLNDSSGVDSRAFYSKEPVRATDFISYYRKLLKRLAKF